MARTIVRRAASAVAARASRYRRTPTTSSRLENSAANSNRHDLHCFFPG